jgi:hypothetical protein
VSFLAGLQKQTKPKKSGVAKKARRKRQNKGHKKQRKEGPSVPRQVTAG